MQSSTGDAAIRIRNLSVYLRNGGALKEVRLLEGEDRRYTMWVRLANRGGEFRVNLFRSDQPKTYKDLDLAMATIRDDFGDETRAAEYDREQRWLERDAEDHPGEPIRDGTDLTEQQLEAIEQSRKWRNNPCRYC